MAAETVEVLKLSLHGVTLGYLAGYQGGRNILVFDPEYAVNPDRPTLTLSGIADHPASKTLFTTPWVRKQRLHPVLSNLLPEGALREWFAQMLKVHPENEFPLFAQLLARSPLVFPLACAATRFAPVFAGDVARAWMVDHTSHWLACR